jgi:hypothetical protein
MAVKKSIVPDETLISKILLIRGKKVMIDNDIAALYGVPTKRLNEQVKRNIKRFPENFMFRLTKKEKEEVVANCDHLKTLKFSPKMPLAFSEHGVLMLANVLQSERAIAMSLKIIDVFVRIKEMLLTHKDILLKLEQLEKKVTAHDENLQMIFKALKQLLNPPQEPRKRIGFKPDD